MEDKITYARIKQRMDDILMHVTMYPVDLDRVDEELSAMGLDLVLRQFARDHGDEVKDENEEESR